MPNERKPVKAEQSRIASRSNAKPRGKTRERLLEAGCKLFSRVGFDGTTISDLEAEAGLKSGTGGFYRHFKNKEELLDEIIANETERLNHMVVQRQKMLENSLGNVRADLLLKFRLRTMGLHQVRDFIDILIREESRFPPGQMEEFRDRFVEKPHTRDAEELERLIEKGEVVDTDPRVLALVITNAIMGNFLVKRYYKMESIGGVTDDEFTGVLADLVTGSLSRRDGT